MDGSGVNNDINWILYSYPKTGPVILNAVLSLVGQTKGKNPCNHSTLPTTLILIFASQEFLAFLMCQHYERFATARNDKLVNVRVELTIQE